MPIGRPPIPIMLSEGEREELESMTRLVLKSLRIGDFTAFKAADLTFVTGLNVIIGANGAGKSHLLKLPYAVMAMSAADRHRLPAGQGMPVPGRAGSQSQLETHS